MSLKSRLVLQSAVFLGVLALALFVPAGTLRFWEAWVYVGLFFLGSVISGVYFYRRDRALVERRLRLGERDPQQRVIVSLAMLAWLAGLVIPALDHRLGWSSGGESGGGLDGVVKLPLWLIIVGQALVVVGYLIALWVLKTNTYAASTIQVEAGQKVISTGPYRIVRHPMYAGGALLLVFTPLALGSYWVLPEFLLITPLLAWRLLQEEKVLCAQLPGYSEYRQRTRFRLIPGIW
jgi:protein-S-isoprenylcysteine O-methyltransferase Ste14